MAAIGAVVVAGAVAVVFAVGLVVLFVIAEQVGERETVVNGDVVDAGPGGAIVVVEQVGGGGHTAGYLADQAAFAAPVAPHRAAIAVVPFRPLRGERADLIAAEAKVPRLGDELDRCQHRVLPYGGEEGSVAVKAVRAARQRGGEIEAETVDVA